MLGDWPEDRLVRVASISKIVTAGVCLASGITADTDMSEALGWPLRHPDAPGTAITAGMVAAHYGGLAERAGTAPPDGMTLASWCRSAAVWAFPPGTVFSYCNLGYVILAAAAEAVTGRRFGDLARDWLTERGIPGGFNFWGVSAEERAKALPLTRPGKGVQIDGTVPSEGLVWPGGAVAAAPNPGEAPWRWSPQGGLRTSLSGCLTLARTVGTVDAAPIWRRGQGPVDGPQSIYQSWGFGLQLLDDPPHWPRPLVGHFGDAYGLRSGVWHDPETGDCFAYLVDGVAETTGPDADEFDPAERALFARAFKELSHAR